MRRIIGRGLFGITAALFMAVAVQAAGINSAEQRVLDAVSQPFSYNGKTYVVNSGSISATRERLSEESMDLTDSFADECISQFSQSYAELVSGGYCEEVDTGDSDNTDSEADLEATPEPKHTKSERVQNKAFLRQLLGDPPESAASEEEETDESSGAKDKVKEETEESRNQSTVSPSPDAAEDDWDNEKDTMMAMDFDSQDMENAMENQLTVIQGSKQYSVQTVEGKSTVGRYVDRYISVWKKVLVVQGIVTVVIIAVMVDYIFASTGRHVRRRKRRSLLAVLTGGCIAGWAFLLFFALGLHFGAFSKSSINRQLMESNYFAGVTQMAREQAAGRLEDNGYDSSIADEVFALANVYIGEKQYIEAVLSGEKNAEVSVDKIHEKLLSRLDGEKDATLIRLIEEDYKNICEFDFGSMIRGSRDSFRVVFYLTLISGIAVLFLLFVLTCLIYRHLYKAVGVGAAGMLIASLAAVLVSVLSGAIVFRQKVKVKPVYYQEFLQNYIRWDIQVIFYFGCVGMLCAVSLLVWRYYLRRFYGR